MKRAVIYARVSDRKQAEEDVSVPAQIEAAQACAAKLGAQVVRVYSDDGRSAFKSGGRRAFEAAIDLAVSMPADYFICWSSSRFARNRYDAVMRKAELQRAGVQLVYVSTPVDLSDDGGWALDGMMEIFDEWASRRNAQDTKRSLVRIASQGYFTGGSVPFGYRSAPAPEAPKRRRLVVEPMEAEIAREAFALRLAGHGAMTIAILLNGRGLLNRGRRWHKSTILGLLRSDSIVGTKVFGRYVPRTKRLAPRDQWLVIKTHEPIIDQETWDQVQAMLDEAAEACAGTGAGSPLSTHPFTGILKCGRCGGSMQIETARNRHGTRYSYYNCRTAQRKDGCQPRRIRADQMDSWLTDAIMARVLGRENLAEIVEVLNEQCSTWATDQRRRKAAVQGRVADVRRKTEKLYEILELHGKDAPNLGDLSRRLRSHTEEIKGLEVELASIDAEKPPLLEVRDEDLDDLADFLRGLVADGTNAKRTRAFYSGFVTGIVVGDDEVTINYDPAHLVAQASGVHSSVIWLPRSRLLRTRAVVVQLPDGLRVAA